LPAHAWVGSYDAAGTAAQVHIPTGTVVSPAGVLENLPRWSGSSSLGTYVEVAESNVVHGVNYGVGLTGSFSGAGTDPSDEVGPFPSDTTQVGPYPYASGKVGPYKLVE
jgi:hypothetical protein